MDFQCAEPQSLGHKRLSTSVLRFGGIFGSYSFFSFLCEPGILKKFRPLGTLSSYKSLQYALRSVCWSEELRSSTCQTIIICTYASISLHMRFLLFAIACLSFCTQSAACCRVIRVAMLAASIRRELCGKLCSCSCLSTVTHRKKILSEQLARTH